MQDSWPNTFIVGPPRSGTTSLFEYLRGHPSVYAPVVKEPTYFSNIVAKEPYVQAWAHQVRDEESYLELYAGAEDHPVRLDASPCYLFDHESLQRIHDRQPEACLIVVLRDPLAQINSHFHKISESLDLGSLREALAHPDWGWYLRAPPRYGDHLTALYDIFDASQIKALRFPDLVRDPSTTLERIWRFLDLASMDVDSSTFETHNSSQMPSNALAGLIVQLRRHTPLKHIPLPGSLRRVGNGLLLEDGKRPMPPGVRTLLAEDYRPQIREAERVLGEDLSYLMENW